MPPFLYECLTSLHRLVTAGALTVAGRLHGRRAVGYAARREAPTLPILPVVVLDTAALRGT